MSKAFNNWKVVLLSVIGATTFWFFNALNKEYDARINYPIRFEFNRDSVVVVKPPPSSISLDVTSGGWNLLRKTFWFNATPIVIQLDNPTEIGYYTKSSLLPMIEDQLNDLSINQMVTDTVFIHIEPRVSKKLKVTLDTAWIDLEDDHRMVSDLVIIPDSVLITGAQSFMDTLKGQYPLKLDVNGISRDFDRKVEVKLPTKHATSDPEKVIVQFEVEKFERQSIEVPVEAVNFPEDSSAYLSHDSVQIFYTIAESQSDDFDINDFAVTADLKMINPEDTSVMAILVYYPEHALELEVIPEHIRVIQK